MSILTVKNAEKNVSFKFFKSFRLRMYDPSDILYCNTDALCKYIDTYF